MVLKFLNDTYPNKSFEPPKKHFAFGELRTKSINTAPEDKGLVSWVYHVAPIIRLNDGSLYVLDPALSANALAKEEWYAKMTQTDKAYISGFVTCKANTYMHYNSCFDPVKNTEEETKCENEHYLSQ